MRLKDRRVFLFNLIVNDIDLVIPWVDGNDPKWLEERNKYTRNQKINPGYYRDWGWMRYWFRCVETNLPWIRYVFFVTYGHTPKWLNLNHPKLRIVNHKDYIPPEFLPTFGGGAFIFNIHRIEGLSETFIYAEDDIFFIGRQRPEDFFSRDGLPKDYLWIKPITEQFHGDFAHIMLNDILLIKKHFNMQQLKNQQEELLYSAQYPDELIADNKKYGDLIYIPGLKESHLAYSFCKSTFKDLWKEEQLEMYKCCKHRFRAFTDVCSMLIRDWQLASGKFSPYFQEGRYFTDTYNPRLKELILSKDTNMLCINESDQRGYTEGHAKEICSWLGKRFPEKSAYELD